jgi:hypothetical protein
MEIYLQIMLDISKCDFWELDTTQFEFSLIFFDFFKFQMLLICHFT